MLYSDKVMDHFRNPRNVGEITDADGVGEVGNPVCGDLMAFYIKVKDNRLADIKYKTFGCGAAIAVSSMVSEMAKGKTLEEAKKITRQAVANELDGLPPNKMHCSNLGAEALHKAIEDYEHKKAGTKPPAKPVEHAHAAESGGDCRCPLCKKELSERKECRPCGKEFTSCSHCGSIVNKDAAQCAKCGSNL
ncbi:MAG: Fe-S cluster assembly scaffold protein NifU [Planctomycetes bacterium]|nr:Fe-S cluster assembly scaffold protein NifU [Planctomycetota bacterium]